MRSAYGRPLPGELVRLRLDTGTSSADQLGSPRNPGTQLGLQLVGRLAAEASSGCEHQGELGVFVVGVLPGSVADSDGRIQVGDELLQVRSISTCFSFGLFRS